MAPPFLILLQVLSFFLSSVAAFPSFKLDSSLHRRDGRLPALTSGTPAALSLPVDDVIDADLVTLPVTAARRSNVDDIGSRQLPLDEEDIGAVVTLPVIHSAKRGLLSRQLDLDLAKRSDVAYYAQMNLGNPPQPVYVQLDTGSFELWVNPDCTAVRPSDRNFCEATGVYNPSTSTTARTLQRGNSLQYGIGTANISYVVDDLSFAGSPKLTQVQFGVATETTDQFAGILGLGHGQNYSTPYPNVMDQLATQGAIRTKAFSLALGSKTEEKGTLVLGGIDTAKFSGSLAAMPVIAADASPDGVARYWVSLQSIAITPPSGRSIQFQGSAMPVFLDSGATLTLLPRQLSDAIATSFGSPGLDSREFYPVDCSLVNTQGTVDFQFAGTTIKVPYSEMIREVARTDGTKSCMLGIVPSPNFVLLGDTFLRSAYAVFDMEADMVYMAQYVNCGSRVMEIRNSQSIAPVIGLCPDPEAVTAPNPNNNGTAGQTDGTVNGGGNGPIAASAPSRNDAASAGFFMTVTLAMLLMQ